ncbi:ParA family protein [Weissella cibaria]|uniref:ParA family protein n=1 Tax=Weissella cibaria TaxID=137591 RepID=UPI001CC5338D|nr:ParA family protein [Weissella cibaria]MBZ6070645.1 ParA family protein [Weissella cibaria]MCS8561225.1 ParA family protein [Weissella cibaria]MCS8565348.1 ParA family protein [Weissella cibaria]MCS8577303.1 ParA family protein [Weissella cibaria]HJF38345.1 ParA family protein [Weissella cibaria]
MKILTFSAIKGGVGKTTLAFNYGEWLAEHGNRVLFMDLDHQSNLSQTYNIYATENTVANIFSGQGQVDIHDVSDNISLIAGDLHLDDVEREIENKTNKNMLLYMWLSDNFDCLNLGRFDYIILDTHPDFSIATRNAAIISHAIISPIIPSEHGYNAKFNLEERLKELREEAIDFQSRKSYVTAQLYFVANIIKHNTKSSHELLDSIKDEESVIGIVPSKELFNRTTLDKESLSTMKQDHSTFLKNREFFEEMDNVFANITKNL